MIYKKNCKTVGLELICWLKPQTHSVILRFL